MDRLQLNAAIERLIESKGADAEARGIVYEFGRGLNPMSRVSGSLQTETSGESFSGHTTEHGEVQINDDKDEVKTRAFGGQRERIGLYKMWRQAERGGRCKIMMSHFWKLDEGTESVTEEPEVWCLACNESGPIWFGERGARVVWDRLGLHVKRYEFVEQWGESLGKRHFGGWSVGLIL